MYKCLIDCPITLATVQSTEIICQRVFTITAIFTQMFSYLSQAFLDVYSSRGVMPVATVSNF